MRNLANAVAFQLAWFAAVIGAGRGHAWPGMLAVALFAVLQLSMDPRQRLADLSLAAWAALAGFALDSLFVASGLLRYAAPWPSPSHALATVAACWALLLPLLCILARRLSAQHRAMPAPVAQAGTKPP